MYNVIGMSDIQKIAQPPDISFFKMCDLPLCSSCPKRRVNGTLDGLPALQEAEEGCFESTKCKPKLLLNATIEIEGFRVKS